ncbi:OsmC family protein [Halosimplex carlsbadense 2-9-1]|uniref:OsmC family protein n=1 Tax=Halosimplex carlsbadense 2-9-1 TaxID=797114 RepID=M0CPE9_9EURY|nr:OsmC family protein [Halosimplex carlsbadense]ELZ23759.1 OsmC family protein [Halosimplex carlsbadense 2-9-1]
MSDIEVTSVCEEGYTVENEIDGEWSLVVDALEEDGPSPNQVLAADYASCYIPAFRVAADQTGYDDIGHVEIEVEADLDEDDDLESMTWTLKVEAALGEDGQEIVELGEEICHVHSALREELHADITLEDDAF